MFGYLWIVALQIFVEEELLLILSNTFVCNQPKVMLLLLLLFTIDSSLYSHIYQNNTVFKSAFFTVKTMSDFVPVFNFCKLIERYLRYS